MAAQLTEEQKQKLAEVYNLSKGRLDYFTLFFMKDDPSAGFTVPTRDYRIFDEHPKFQLQIFQNYIDKVIDKSMLRLAVASPRGFTKSASFSIFFPLHCACFKTYRKILLVSNSESLAINFLRQVRINLESNERITKGFGTQKSDKWTENHLITRQGVEFRACGWGAQIRGFRPDLIIMDDIETDETVASEETTRKIEEWILKAAINSLSADGAIVFVGTLISRLSIIYKYVHTPPEGWKSLFRRAYLMGREEPGYELWPKVWPHERLQARKKEIGSWAFASEFMNEPIPSGGNAFDPRTFKYFNESHLKDKQLGLYIGIDPAFSENQSADFGCISYLWHDNEDNIYVHKYFRERTTSGKLIEEFIKSWKMYSSYIRAVGIEQNGPQKAFYSEMMSTCMREGIYAPFKKLTGMIKTNKGVVNSKKDRIIYTLQPRLEQGKFFIREGQHELVNELTLYPEVKHDDLLDATSYAVSLIEPLQDYSNKIEHDEPELVTADHGVTGYGDTYGSHYAQEEEYFQYR